MIAFLLSTTSLPADTTKRGTLIVPVPDIVCVALPDITSSLVPVGSPVSEPFIIIFPLIAVCPVVCVIIDAPALMVRLFILYNDPSAVSTAAFSILRLPRLLRLKNEPRFPAFGERRWKVLFGLKSTGLKVELLPNGEEPPS